MSRRSGRGLAAQLFFIATAAFCLVALVGGGSAEGTVLDRGLVPPAALLLAVAGWRIALAPAHQGDVLRRLWLWPALALALPLLQLLPLPPDLWAALPGRAALASELQAAGVAPGWQPFSVHPAATLDFALGLLPAIAVFVAAATLHGHQRRWLLMGVLAFAVLSTLLGLLQMVDGPQSLLYPYEVTNRGSAVGFFANRNHLASLLAVMLPVTVGRLADRVRHQARPVQDLSTWLLAGAVVVLAVGVTATLSRAGFLLMMVSVGGSLLVLLRGSLRQRDAGRDGGRAATPRVWLQLAGVVALALMLQYTLFTLLQRVHDLDALEDGRWTYAGWVRQAAAPAAGLGWGLGSFADVYDEAGPVVAREESYLNHAHNDYLELWLEGGALALIPVLALVVAVLRRLVQAWRRDAQDPQHHPGLKLGVGMALLLLALHSFLDYPLRTTALGCLAALLLAELYGSVRARRETPATLPQETST